jgi:DNA-binding transcriptional regulator YiaG
MDGIDLKRTRVLLGMTQSELAREFEKTLRTIQNWETKKELPKFVGRIVEQLKSERR